MLHEDLKRNIIGEDSLTLRLTVFYIGFPHISSRPRAPHLRLKTAEKQEREEEKERRRTGDVRPAAPPDI